MDDQRWAAVDDYLTDTLVGPDAALDAALAANRAAGLPPIDVSPTEGKLLHLLARATGARRVLEIARSAATAGTRSRCSRPSRGSPRRRCRPWGRRATTGSPWPWWARDGPPAQWSDGRTWYSKTSPPMAMSRMTAEIVIAQ